MAGWLAPFYFKGANLQRTITISVEKDQLSGHRTFDQWSKAILQLDSMFQYCLDYVPVSLWKRSAHN